MALAASFGDGKVSARDLAAGLRGAVIKDEEKDTVRLAGALASLKDASQPTLYDLRDAATVLIGRGSRSSIAESMTRVEVGTRIGSLPEGSRQTSIQIDFNEKLKSLKLQKYRSPVTEALKLDLRENRRVSNEKSAWLDLHRSFFCTGCSNLVSALGGSNRKESKPRGKSAGIFHGSRKTKLS